MTSRLDGPSVPPASGTARQLVVLVHGYGADGNDLIALAPHLQDALPDAAFVAPDGPEPCGMSPMGRQWFAIDFDDPSRMSNDPHQAMERFSRMDGAADEVAPLLNTFLDEELKRNGLGPEALALVGFSQGTMMSLHVGLRRNPPPAAILGFSGALLGPERLLRESVAPVPVQLVHGDSDDLVPPLAMFAAAGSLGRAGVPVGFHISRGIGHGIAPDGIGIAARHLRQAFEGRLSVQPPVSSPWPG
ncbi:MAG: alpha/beta hydrolase [Minwuia sp.]|uniref:alpha/beta hydrolase n=1 Tax=Minwuia sp. TaxID=2493630 RepID=UPI003A851DF9